jgi:hypothetical protein
VVHQFVLGQDCSSLLEGHEKVGEALEPQAACA